MLLFHTLKKRRVRVLFVCLGNSYRSRMAETFANAYGSDIVEATSAGFMPARTSSQTARRLMSEKGLELELTAPRRYTNAELEAADFIVNMCEFGLPKTTAPVVKTKFPDPVGKPDEERREIRDRIEVFVQVMLAQFRQARDEWPFDLDLDPELEANVAAASDGGSTASWSRTVPASVQSPLEGLPV